MKTITMTTGAQTFEIELYDNPSAKALRQALPMDLSMSRWGGEYYGSISRRIPVHSEMTSWFKEGEVALWPDGNAFCIFFGPTPVSTDSRPKMASPGVPLGRIVRGSLEDLDAMGGSIRLTLT
ncbi:cyclophilin-like fold protein [Anaerotalea alkaliphila]|uniref:Cyclophilin TM1367-like domain-containing protein n=1 Tax=Anaerotalea alkaliphila TaxID=2662126 RepID=A0A7X5KLY9_9FIRM|nr:cyclophilin-like fold protein [Anaerotalea alkaliphila]NDL67234.1 hypothetical protein [Anaerotalea alkaliphila]